MLSPRSERPQRRAPGLRGALGSRRGLGLARAGTPREPEFGLESAGRVPGRAGAAGAAGPGEEAGAAGGGREAAGLREAPPGGDAGAWGGAPPRRPPGGAAHRGHASRGAAHGARIGEDKHMPPETGQSAGLPACDSHGHGHPERAETTDAQGRCAPHNARLGIGNARTRQGRGPRPPVKALHHPEVDPTWLLLPQVAVMCHCSGLSVSQTIVCLNPPECLAMPGDR
nr:paraneoplastic antigen Ma6E-like [Loxodonta africana]